jgi:hypothetical protein
LWRRRAALLQALPPDIPAARVAAQTHPHEFQRRREVWQPDRRRRQRLEQRPQLGKRGRGRNRVGAARGQAAQAVVLAGAEGCLQLLHPPVGACGQ